MGFCHVYIPKLYLLVQNPPIAREARYIRLTLLKDSLDTRD